MKVVLLAGGRGSRMSELTDTIPKPMVAIGGYPVLWHIMKTYSYFGHNDFILCLGYKGHIIKDYFLKYAAMNYDCRMDLGSPWVEPLEENKESNWKITFIDTGLTTQTGGRIKRIQNYIGNEPFLASYGDGVANVNIDSLIETHKFTREKYNCLGTLTAVPSTSKLGEIEWSSKWTVGGLVDFFEEKSKVSYINGGFFVFEPEIFDHIMGDDDYLESGLLTKLTKMGKLGVYEHKGFWGTCNTMKELGELNKLAEDGNPPWRLYN